MTNKEFRELEIDDRLSFSEDGAPKQHGKVIGYTGIRIQFDDGLIVEYPFNSPIAKDFEITDDHLP